MTEQRLSSIEEKLNTFESKFEQLADAIIKLTLIEERIAAVIEGNKDLRNAIKDNNHRIQSLERKAERSQIFEKITWLIITIAIGGYFAGKLFLGKL